MDALALGGASVRCFSVSGGGESSNKISAPSSSPVCIGVGSRKVPRLRRSKVVLGVSSCDYFREKDHLDYYYNYSSPEGRGRVIARAEKIITHGKGACNGVETKEKKKMKKMLKKILLAQIPDGVPISSEIRGFFSDRVNSYGDRVEVSKKISYTAEVLLEQLEQLKLDGMDLKMARRKDSEMMSSSSSSSESSDSDSECKEVVTDTASIKMRTQQNSSDTVALENGKPSLEAEALPAGFLVKDVNILNYSCQPPVGPVPAADAALVYVSVSENGSTTATEQNHPGQRVENSPVPLLTSEVTTKVNPPNANVIKSPIVVANGGILSSTKKIEVCMGGKCKKSGSVGLLGEFQRLLGQESAAVSGCKCMGRCRDGPNVRILDEDPLGNTTNNSLCIGTGLKDVGLIVENYIAQCPELGLNVGL